MYRTFYILPIWCIVPSDEQLQTIERLQTTINLVVSMQHSTNCQYRQCVFVFPFHYNEPHFASLLLHDHYSSAKNDVRLLQIQTTGYHRD